MERLKEVPEVDKVIHISWAENARCDQYKDVTKLSQDDFPRIAEIFLLSADDFPPLQSTHSDRKISLNKKLLHLLG